MLVLTRRVGETVVIGDPSNPIGTVRIAQLRGDGRVLLGFSFPPQIPVHRQEVADAKILEAQEALAPVKP